MTPPLQNTVPATPVVFACCSSSVPTCLSVSSDLWAEVLGGRRRFLMYRQFKMYNDPALNPVLYSKI